MHRVLALLLVFALGCASEDAHETDALARVKAANKLVIAYANEEPFGYLDPQTQTVTGEAPAIARVVAERLNIAQVEPVLTEWKSLIPGLKAGRFDCIAAGMYITPERAENVLFSNPTYRIGEAFLVKTGNPLALHSYRDLVESGAKLGVVRGTVERGYARSLGIADERVLVFPDNNAAVAGVQAGQVDAFAGTALTVQTLVDKLGNAGVERASPFDQPVIDGEAAMGYRAFAFRLEDQTLRDAFNVELKTFLGSREHRQLVAPFGFTEQELPNGMTTDQLLKKTSE